MSDMHLRLYTIRTPEKRAVVTVDQFFTSTEMTRAWVKFERLDDGRVLYALRQDGTGKTTRGAAVTTREAVERVILLIELEYGPVANPIEFASEGLDNMGLWAALGDDSGFAQE